MNRHDLAEILRQALPGGDWTLARPTDGLSRASYLARRGEQRVFLKLAACTPALQRLADLGVAPRVLAGGTALGQPFVVQEYIAGTYPDWRWLSTHLADLAALITLYHTDAALARLLTPPDRLSYRQHVLQELQTLRTDLAAAATAPLQQAPVRHALAELARQASLRPEAPLVPTHADPNTRNFLLAADRIYLLDWDEVLLSDPLRDIGLLLWWYVPEARWGEFFAACGQPLDAAARRRISWWCARASLRVALWFDAAGDAASAAAFVTDFLAALHGRANPRAPFPPAGGRVS